MPEDPSIAEPEQAAERRVTLRATVPTDRLLVGYKAPAQSDPDWQVLDLISALLAGGPSARLVDRLVNDEAVASDVESFVLPFRDPSLMQLSVNLMRGHRAQAALDALDAETERLCAEPVDRVELDKTKNELETSFWAPLATGDGKAEALGHFETTLGDFRSLFREVENLRRISADDVLRVARLYLQPERRSVAVAEPDA